jgi:hypothetical protein
MPFTPAANVVSVAPTDASAITNAAARAAGFGVAGAGGGWSLTPQVTGRVLVIATGIITGGGAGTATLQLTSGTGAAPANAASSGLGTAVGGIPAYILDATGLQAAFVLSWVFTGLAVPAFTAAGLNGTQTPVWFDILQTMSASSLALQKVNLIAMEL